MDISSSDTENSDFSLNSEERSLLEEEVTITTKLKNDEEGTTCTATITSVSVRKVRVVVSFVGKLVLPAVVGVYYAYLRNKHTLTEVLPTIIAFLTNGIAKYLSSVQGAVTYPSNKIDPLLQVIKLRYRPNSIPTLSNEQLPDSSDEATDESVLPISEQCVTCTVLSAPENEPIRADVIFVHGLHGSLSKTWRQGNWKMAEEKAKSVEQLRRRASTSCLQTISAIDQQLHQALKRSASTNSTDTRRRKISKDDFDNRVFCDCGELECGNCTGQNHSSAGFEREISTSALQAYSNALCSNKSECWPKDWLPIDCPGVRVIALTYTTDPYLWRPVWIKGQSRKTMEERSAEMLKLLLKNNVGDHPIVWVGHSKGGLFVKQLLVDAWERKAVDPFMNNLHQQTKGIMFYSVPHRGSSLADFTLPFIRKSVELLEIGRDCNKVLDLHDKFLQIFKDQTFQPEIFSFIETSLTFMVFVYLRIVTFDSADPGVGETLGVPLDHREICKPTSRECFLYQELVELILRST